MAKQQDTRQNRKRIMFSYNTDLDSPVGIVFQYLMQNPHLPRLMGKRKGVDAIFAFWRPFAFQAMGQASDAELKLMARESLVTLAHQMDQICETFGVEHPRSVELGSTLEATLQQAMVNVIRKFLVRGVLASQGEEQGFVRSRDFGCE